MAKRTVSNYYIIPAERHALDEADGLNAERLYLVILTNLISKSLSEKCRRLCTHSNAKGDPMPRRTSLKTIQMKILELEARADQLRREDKPGIKELRSVIAKFKLKPADIKLALKKGRVKLDGRGPSKGRKLKPKYHNPKNKNETWAGRGLKPKWLSAMLKQGKKLEEFAI